ncbi:hypothetical protein ES5_11011 [Dietzia cinnamea P4]|nr:hypothetical protein ES5_11011 [Dietzia cinnamea P4]
MPSWSASTISSGAVSRPGAAPASASSRATMLGAGDARAAAVRVDDLVAHRPRHGGRRLRVPVTG